MIKDYIIESVLMQIKQSNGTNEIGDYMSVVMDHWAKQQAIAFANFIAYNNIKSHDIDTWNGGKYNTHELYDDFLEHQRIERQFIEQQNKLK